MISECNLCFEIRGKPSANFGSQYNELVRSKENQILETDNFILVPSVGPLNESHVMLVPKRHVTSFAMLTSCEKKESANILETLSKKFRSKYKHELIFFESGAGSLTAHSGGCIDHAHIHCLQESKVFEAQLFSEVALIEEESTYLNADIQLGYLWYRKKTGDTFICNSPLLPSQFMRYLYAESTNSGYQWNWRKYSKTEDVIRVLEKYHGIFGNTI